MQQSARSTERDGIGNKIEFYALTHFKRLWNAAQRNRLLEKKVNRTLINRAILKMATRPYPLSTMGGYTSWDSLTDRTYSGRHLPPAQPTTAPPPIDEVVRLFERKLG